MQKAIEITDNNFSDTVLNSKVPVLVDFWAEWCGPCRMMLPIIEELADQYKDKAVIGKLNVDQNPTISTKYGVRSIPTLLFFKEGEIAEKHVGASTKEDLANKINKYL